MAHILNLMGDGEYCIGDIPQALQQNGIFGPLVFCLLDNKDVENLEFLDHSGYKRRLPKTHQDVIKIILAFRLFHIKRGTALQPVDWLSVNHDSIEEFIINGRFPYILGRNNCK